MLNTRSVNDVHPGGRELTWRLLAGDARLYGASWANYGRDWIRDDYNRLYLLESGIVSVETQVATFMLKPGELWLVPGGVPARYRCLESMRLHWAHFNVFTIPEIDLLSGGSPRAMPADGSSLRAFQSMLGAQGLDQPMAFAIAVAVLGQLAAPFLASDWDAHLPDAGNVRKLRPAVDRIVSNFSGDCSVNTLAACVNLHPVYFSRVFRLTFGCAPGRYVTEVRMRRAVAWLTSTDLPVKAVGMACGYPDPYHFSRAFKRHTGVSPRSYRLAFRK